MAVGQNRHPQWLLEGSHLCYDALILIVVPVIYCIIPSFLSLSPWPLYNSPSYTPASYPYNDNFLFTAIVFLSPL